MYECLPWPTPDRESLSKPTNAIHTHKSPYSFLPHSSELCGAANHFTLDPIHCSSLIEDHTHPSFLVNKERTLM